jgi:hypothetical protein
VKLDHDTVHLTFADWRRLHALYERNRKGHYYFNGFLEDEHNAKSLTGAPFEIGGFICAFHSDAEALQFYLTHQYDQATTC